MHCRVDAPLVAVLDAAAARSAVREIPGDVIEGDVPRFVNIPRKDICVNCEVLCAYVVDRARGRTKRATG